MRIPFRLYSQNPLENKEMKEDNLKNNIIVLTGLCIISLMLFLSFIHSNHTFAAGIFSVEAKIDLKSLNHPEKLKVVASANGETATRYLTGNDLNSDTVSVSFDFYQKNDIVTVGKNDEFFVCSYAMDPITNQMQSYSCVEGNIENTDGKNKIDIGSGVKKTLSTGTFQTVSGGEINGPTINVKIPLSDRKEVTQLKVVTMIRGEFESIIINAQELLKNTKDNTIILPLFYESIPEIGSIQEGDIFYACVSANELNPPEGTECEHRVTSHTFRIHNIITK